jgi:hypothetical protein
MRVLKMAAVSFGLALASPGLAVAQEAFVAGAITGALTGGLAGGPIGAAIGGLAGAAIGGAAEAEHARRQSVRPVADLGSVPRVYSPPQRTTEPYSAASLALTPLRARLPFSSRGFSGSSLLRLCL